MKIFIYAVIIFISASLLIQSCNNNNTKTSVQKYKIDTLSVKFLRNALEGGLAGIKAAELAASRSQNERITNLAKMILADHTKADEKLKKIETVNALTGNDTISASHRNTIDDLSKNSGVKFDKAYIKTVIKDHEDAVLMLINATQVKDSTLRTFAKKTLPLVQKHLDSARNINKDLK